MTGYLRRLEIAVGETIRRVCVAADGSMEVDGWPREVRVNRIDETTFQVTLDGRRLLVYVATKNGRGWAFADGCAVELDLKPDRSRPRQADDPTQSLSAPMPATVLAVVVKPGQSVRQGDPLILLEAMKMELTLRAPRDGRVETVACSAGDLVQPGVPLATLADGDSDSADR